MAAHQDSLSITNAQSSLKLMSTESVMPSNHLVLCRSLLLWPSIFSSIRVFSKKSVLCIKWPKDWSFSFSISPSNEYSGLISFRSDYKYLRLFITSVNLNEALTACPAQSRIFWLHVDGVGSLLRNQDRNWGPQASSGPAAPPPPPPFVSGSRTLIKRAVKTKVGASEGQD